MLADAVRVMKAATYCCFVLCLTGCSGRVTLGANRADPEAISAAQELVRAVGVRWDENVFDASVAPNFYKQVKRSDVAAFLTTVRAKLGTLKSIKVIKSDETQSEGSSGETKWLTFYSMLHSRKATVKYPPRWWTTTGLCYSKACTSTHPC